MTFTWQSQEVAQGKYYVSITQDKDSNILKVQAWECDGYGLAQHLINEYSYHKDEMGKAKATFRRYVKKLSKLESKTTQNDRK